MNPVLHKLGFGPEDRVVVVHADDIGMCQATLPALEGLLDAGLLSSAAVMVPCPWFPATAAFCRKHPSVDMGVHLTLTSEWDQYRWGPILSRDHASGLLDAEGYFFRSTPEVMEHGKADAVAVELAAQVDRAREAGIDITHVDSHMGSVFDHKFLPAYLDVAFRQQVPPFFPAIDEEGARASGVDERTLASGREIKRILEERAAPIFDDLRALPLNHPGDQMEVARHLFDTLKPGLSVLLLHPSVDTPELRAIAPDWQSRVANYEVCTRRELREHVRNAGIEVIGYRALRDAMHG
jgi:hypothetical protein